MLNNLNPTVTEHPIVQQLAEMVRPYLWVRTTNPINRDEAVIFQGVLRLEAEAVFEHLREPFRRLGYVPILRRTADGTDIVVAQKSSPTIVKNNLWLNLALLALTFGSTVIAGANIHNLSVFSVGRELSGWMQILLAGGAFAFTLLLILGVHEFGHFFVARWHGLQVTLPFFIPAPFGLGTFGAVIQMKSPLDSRKALFDVGIAGPLAGIVVAIPLLMLGLLTSPIIPTAQAGGIGSALNYNLLMNALVGVLIDVPAGMTLQLNAIAIAAWFGLFITAMNLLPLGQLDGGHIAYATFGKWARGIGWLTMLGLLVASSQWGGWLTWALFALLSGLRPAQPLNDITPLDGYRRMWAVVWALLFLLLITPQPFLS
ncbi:MAG TPA: site-2 protease family protein [Anaerolineales bacterium]|nr:site-2 protease family protein [Anaerolineales bacterium]